MRPTKYPIIALLLSLALLVSCSRYKNLVYLQPGQSDPEVFVATPPAYHIQQRVITSYSIHYTKLYDEDALYLPSPRLSNSSAKLLLAYNFTLALLVYGSLESCIKVSVTRLSVV